MLYSIEREIEKANYEQLSNYTGDKEYKVYIIGMPQTNFIIAGKECNDKKQAVIRQNTILGVLKKYKESKTKRQGKVTEIENGPQTESHLLVAGNQADLWRISHLECIEYKITTKKNTGDTSTSQRCLSTVGPISQTEVKRAF